MASTRVKVLLLIFILGMPVLMYLFLQGFGENEYNVPLFYQEGLPDQKFDCPDPIIPHQIDHLISQGPCWSWDCSMTQQKLVLFSFLGSDCQDNLSEVARICNRFKDEPTFCAVTLSLDSATNKNLMTSYLKQYPIGPDAWLWWSYDPAVTSIINCGFNLEQNCTLSQQAVLVDQHYRIRGYYKITDPEELDRLVTEISILKNEENS